MKKSNGAPCHVVELSAGVTSDAQRSFISTACSKLWYCCSHCNVERWVLNPYSNLYYYWLAFVSFACVYNILMIIVRAVFIDLQVQYHGLCYVFTIEISSISAVRLSLEADYNSVCMMEDEEVEWYCCSHCNVERWVLNPYSNLYYYWLAFVSFACVYNILMIIVRAVFIDLQVQYHGLWYSMDFLCDAVYLFDMIVRFRTGFLEQGQLVRDTVKLKRNYAKLKNPIFILDVLSMIPVDIFLLVIDKYSPATRMNRLLKFPRVREFCDRTETRTSFPNAFRITNLVFYIFVIIHWNACIYFQISKFIGLGSDKWVFPNISQPRFSAVGTQYVYCLYWSTVTLTCIGEQAQPEKDGECLFVILDYLAGVLIFATIVGSVGNMIGNLNVSRSQFQQRIDAVKRYMEFRKVGKHLEKRVLKWFDYLWHNRQAMDEELTLSLLPEKLKAEILMNVHLDTLRRVRILRGCEPGLLQELVLKLRLQVFSPADYVCRKGDVGREMYIVKRGKLSVISDDEQTIYANLTEGSVFGEISILDIPGNKTGNRRTANVRSEGYSDLFCLSKEDLWKTLSDYPDAKEKLIQRGRQLLIDQKLLDEREEDERLMREEKAAKAREASAAKAAKLEEELKFNPDDIPGEVRKLMMELDGLYSHVTKVF
ncbi:cyclic nucleotide-gated channel alpha-3-like [Tubulanus polymorphus]|uniref:cyclic nucleotide-gated channel alpha-3-like n=1 Tax=Tubulanus polymorphus TaxID=672921 RepID=UPI003DA22263